jgi:hypothetical protein
LRIVRSAGEEPRRPRRGDFDPLASIARPILPLGVGS